MTEAYEMGVDSWIDDVDEVDVDPDATPLWIAAPTEADYLDVVRPGRAELVEEHTYRDWLAEQRYQYAMAPCRQKITRLPGCRRAGHNRRPARRNRGHHRASTARAPADGDAGGDGPAPPQPLSVASLASSTCQTLLTVAQKTLLRRERGASRRVPGQIDHCHAPRLVTEAPGHGGGLTGLPGPQKTASEAV